MSVDFPAPLGPSSPVIPERISKSIPSSAGNDLKVFVICFNETKLVMAKDGVEVLGKKQFSGGVCLTHQTPKIVLI